MEQVELRRLDIERFLKALIETKVDLVKTNYEITLQLFSHFADSR